MTKHQKEPGDTQMFFDTMFEKHYINEICIRWCLFHQHFTSSFFVQLFCTYSLRLSFLGNAKLAKKLNIKCW